MGLINSGAIQQQRIEHGRGEKTPVAIIERGTQSNQKLLLGTLAELEDLAKGASSPSLIVVGEVVSLATKLSWFQCEQEINMFDNKHAFA